MTAAGCGLCWWDERLIENGPSAHRGAVMVVVSGTRTFPSNFTGTKNLAKGLMFRLRRT